MNKIRESFATTLRVLRMKSDISQEALGLESGLGRTYVGELERGIKTPTITTLFKLCEPLNLKPSEFMTMIEKRLKKNG